MNHNGVVGHYPPGMPGQKFDDFIFNLGQVDVPAVYPDQSFVKNLLSTRQPHIAGDGPHR